MNQSDNGLKELRKKIANSSHPLTESSIRNLVREEVGVFQQTQPDIRKVTFNTSDVPPQSTHNQSSKPSNVQYPQKQQSKKLTSSETEDSLPISLWDRAVKMVNSGNLTGAYKEILDSEDDIYMIKLMMLTGPCMSDIEPEIATRLLNRICLVHKSKFLEKMYMNVFDHALQEGLFNGLTKIESRKAADEVYQLSSSSHEEVGETAAELYIKLAKHISSLDHKLH